MGRSLAAAPLDPLVFAAYGTAVSGPLRPDVSPGGEAPVLRVVTAAAAAFPLAIPGVRRWRQAGRVILPLGAHRWILVVAPGLEAPEWESLRAFIAAPREGVSLRRGTWHAEPIGLSDGDDFALLEAAAGATEVDAAEAPFPITLLRPV